MRASFRFISAAVATALLAAGGSLWGCGDLLHDTDFTQADLDPDPPPVPTFCDWSRDVAKRHAYEACARLLACESGFGAGSPAAAGKCIENALLAYDCTAAPNRPVRQESKTHEFWNCLWRARTCRSTRGKIDVASCVIAGQVLDCGDERGYTGCGNYDPEAGAPDLRNVRVECRLGADQGFADPCVATGRTCGATGDTGFCTGSTGLACARTGCSNNTQLSVCADAGTFKIDRGLDCAAFGAGSCVETDAGPACRVVNDAGSPCPPTGDVKCEGNVAVGCPSGARETVDCEAFGATCISTSGGDGWDVARACRGTSPECDADQCEGENLKVCLRGRFAATLACSEYGLGRCTEFPISGGGKQATCGPPL